MVEFFVTGDRRYADREVGLILKRVAELHEREGESPDAGAMTQAEIEEAVAELGISKALVTRATTEMSVEDVRNRRVWWLGGKTDVLFETVVDGRVDDPTFTAMIEILRRFLGDPGETRNEASTRIWSASSARRVHFTVVEHAETTTLRLEESMPIDARATVGIRAFAGGTIGFMAMVPLKALVIKAVLLLAMGPLVLVGAGLGWWGGTMVWKRRSGGREGDLRRAMGEIVAIAARPRPELAAPAPE